MPAKAPAHLSDEARRFYRAVLKDYSLEPHHLIALTAACEAFDRMRSAQAAVKRDGEYLPGRFGT